MIGTPLRVLRIPALAAMLLAAGVAHPAHAQEPQLPPGVTPEQAARLLQQRPELGEIVRQRLLESGLTPDQVRARLRAAGFPSGMLDQYLVADTVAPPDPSERMIQAISVLGLARFSQQDSLLLTGDTIALRLYMDSLRLDSIRMADSLARVRPELSVFGLDVFRQPTTQFQPIVTGPVDESYRLGPGDLLVLILTGAVEIAHQLEVTRSGFIVIPNVGRIYVSNLTLGQLTDVLYDRLGRVYSGIGRGADAKTKFDVVVARVRVQTIRVVGEVARPGTYQIPATGGVLAALYEAGGLTERGSFRRVEVRRGSGLVATVDLYDYLLRGTLPERIRLSAGDHIFVPVHGPHVKIAGEVVRPAIYELRPGETLKDLVEIAGGLTPFAETRAATIDRILPPGERPEPGRSRTVLTANLESTLDGSESVSVELYPADSVTVFAVSGPRRNAVTIRGSVWQPGTFELEPGMRLWDLIAMAGGLRPETYAGRAQILRLRPDSTLQLLGVPLSGGPGTDAGVNPLLQESDEVTIYATTEFRPQRYIAVFGAVRSPGVFTFADSMTLRDAVLLAGGLQDDAYLVEAEVSRLRQQVGDDSDSLAVVLKIPLDSTYVFDASGRVERPVGSSASPVVPLEPYDNVFVRRQPGWEVQRNVVVTGEVRFPGRYTLLAQDERLLSVIRRAGGLTRQAYANGIRFFRSEDDAGRIAVDLPEVLSNPDFRDNLVLAAGDSIHIPAYIPTVRVEGAVNSPGSVAYVPRKGTAYYIDAAGGFSRLADKRRTFIQQPNGSIQDKGKRPEPGAVVVVPSKDPDAVGIDFVRLFSNLAQILAATATVIVVLVRR